MDKDKNRKSPNLRVVKIMTTATMQMTRKPTSGIKGIEKFNDP